MKYPYDLAIDSENNIYVCEYGNCRVQKFSPHGESLAIYGKPGRAEGEFYSPWGVCIHKSHKLLVADTQNNRIAILYLETP